MSELAIIPPYGFVVIADPPIWAIEAHTNLLSADQFLLVLFTLDALPLKMNLYPEASESSERHYQQQ